MILQLITTSQIPGNKKNTRCISVWRPSDHEYSYGKSAKYMLTCKKGCI